MNPAQMHWWGLLAGYAMLIFPLSILLWKSVPLVGKSLTAIARMTVQLLFVGLYLQVLFEWNHPLVTLAWLVVMLMVADGAILRGCGLKLSTFAPGLLGSLLVGTALPLVFFVGVILWHPDLLDARLVIPIAGMIMGNCMSADIIGVRSFYSSVASGPKAYRLRLAQGATLREATGPYLKEALRASLAPTVARTATIGLVSLPGMMTGQMLGGAEPMTAIMYQIAIMIAIFTGTSITVLLAIVLTRPSAFDDCGMLREGILKE